ncbi:unnamed protein product [Medioppia subpectinata]|uniref:Uncharacterized protein n=1 Tax=Medioppia subpectinata TaxID=1979941 RepID=A0A7R9Q5S9_9ACAR|nr:unnamed protein product [Medioppia subpectinata]CAG2113803.1 unnamed protein product [Medioppia subpectinata]
MYMLFINKSDKCLHDCNEIENGGNDDSDLIQDYKRESRRLSYPAKDGSASKKANGQNGNHQKAGNGSLPAKSRQFMFTRSDSESSLSSLADDDNENDWKVLSVCFSGKHTLIGLIIVSGKLLVLTVKLRINSPMNSPNASRHHSLEKPELYCLIPPMSSARCAVGTAMFDGKLFVCGGYDRGECLKTVEVYDENKNRWYKLNPMLVPRGRFDITVVNGDVYAIGGCDGQNELNSAEMYESSTKEWKYIPNCPVVRSNAVIDTLVVFSVQHLRIRYTILKNIMICFRLFYDFRLNNGLKSLDGQVYVIGGWNGQRGLTRCDVYNPKTQQWIEIKPLITGRYQTGVAVLDHSIYAVGGCDSWTCLNSAEVYTSNGWQSIAPLHTARRGCGVIAFNGKIYAIGGHDGVHALCSVEVYDPTTDQWASGPPLTSCRANVGVTVVDKRLYAVGGFNGKIFLNTIEFLDLETNEWTTSVSKCDITVESPNGVANGGHKPHDHNHNNGKEYNNNEINGKHSNGCVAGDIDGYNYTFHSSSKTKASLNASEPLLEVEETTAGH